MDAMLREPLALEGRAVDDFTLPVNDELFNGPHRTRDVYKPDGKPLSKIESDANRAAHESIGARGYSWALGRWGFDVRISAHPRMPDHHVTTMSATAGTGERLLKEHKLEVTRNWFDQGGSGDGLSVEEAAQQTWASLDQLSDAVRVAATPDGATILRSAPAPGTEAAQEWLNRWLLTYEHWLGLGGKGVGEAGRGWV